MVASGTRNARAISPVVRPPTARSVSATCDGAARASGGSTGTAARASRRRRRRPASAAGTRRGMRIASQRVLAVAGGPARCAAGRSAAARRPGSARRAGRPARRRRGHCMAAASSASWTASSAASKWPYRRTSAPRTCGASSRSRSSTRGFGGHRRYRVTVRRASISGRTSMVSPTASTIRARDLQRPVVAVAVDDGEAGQHLLRPRRTDRRRRPGRRRGGAPCG